MTTQAQVSPVPPGDASKAGGGAEATTGAAITTGEGRSNVWSDKNVRTIFIRKVYCILTVQLLVTLGIVSIFTFCDDVQDYVEDNEEWYWASYMVFFFTFLILSLCSDLRRQTPWNLVFLGIFTVALSYMLAMLASFYETEAVVVSLGITALVCLSVTLLSFTKVDVTSCLGILIVLCGVMFFSGLLFLIALPNDYVQLVEWLYAALGAIIFTVFLVVDTQLMMGNKNYTISPEEYILAALNIYLDIVYIFASLLQLIGDQS